MLIADTQFGLAAYRLKELAGRTTAERPGEFVAPPGTPETGWSLEAGRLAEAVQLANAIEPDFVAVLGDMVMNWDDPNQAGDVLSGFKNLSPEIPVHYVPGNHDVGVDFKAPTAESLAVYRNTFGPDRYTFTSGPCRFIVFNTPVFDQPESMPEEYEAQFNWLEEELATPAQEGINHTVALSHHPPFLRDVDEETGTFNLPQPGRQRLLDLLSDHGVENLFTGHTHANVLTRYARLKVIATTSISLAQAGRTTGYRVVRADENSISHSFYRS